jgi:hypothetical protein
MAKDADRSVTSGCGEALQRAERRVLRAARKWFDQLRPLGWSEEKHLHAPRCNATSDAAENLAAAVAAHALKARKK